MLIQRKASLYGGNNFMACLRETIEEPELEKRIGTPYIEYRNTAFPAHFAAK
jgi:hypothetical protein